METDNLTTLERALMAASNEYGAWNKGRAANPSARAKKGWATRRLRELSRQWMAVRAEADRVIAAIAAEWER